MGFVRVLDHERHALGLGPAQAEEGAALGLAGLERDPGPAQGPAEGEVFPIVGALVHEEGFAGAHGMDVDPVGFQVVGEGLLHVKDDRVDPGVLQHEPVQDGVHVGRVSDRAVEVRREPVDILGEGDLPDRDEPRVVPAGVVPGELHLEAF